MFRLVVCWFRGHLWRYDRHVWGSGMEPFDRYLCERCGRDQFEPIAVPEGAAA